MTDRHSAQWAAIVLGLISVAAVVGPWLMFQFTGFSDETQAAANALAMPSRAHWLGTDLLGRDVLIRLLSGTRVSLTVGLIATAVALVLGVTYGAIAGYAGGRIDEAMMRVVDLLYCLPTIMLIVVLLALFERSLPLVVATLGAISWLTIARITRGEVLRVKAGLFVEAARAAGASAPRVLVSHIVPHVLPPIAVYATLAMPLIMLDEAFLSFLGLGVPPPAASWGVLVQQGANAMAVRPLLLVAPMALMGATILALNVIGDALRDSMARH
jgi:oligopeptide transport system permease protein